MGQSAYSIAMQQMGNLIDKANLHTEALNAALEPVYAQLENIWYDVTTFGAVGDGVTDDYSAIWRAIETANSNRGIVYFPNGAYLIGQTIDFTNLPRTIESGAEDYSYRMVIRGQDVSKTFLIGAPGLNKMFVYSPTNRLLTRSFTFENLKIRSRDPFNDQTIRAPLKAFEMLACPFTHFRNIDFLGINECIHLQSCYFSTLTNIAASRIRRGIFLDGTDPTETSYGFADFCYLRDIRVGGWPNDWGLKILGSKGTKVINFDSEAGYTGPALLLQGCHNIDIDTMYFENFANAQPILITGNPTLNSVTDFCTNITLSNGHIYNLQTSFIRFQQGVDDVTVKQCRFMFNYDAANPLNNPVAGLYSFAGAPGPGFGNVYKNISILDNNYYHKSNYALVFQEGYSTLFNHNGKTYLNTGNIPFYSPSFRRGMEVIQLASDQNYESFLVEETGSYGTLAGVTASVTSGSNVATFSDVTNIVPGTYLTIGSWARVQVMSKNPSTNRVVLGETSPTTISSGSVSYANPILRYKYKALAGFTADRPTGFYRVLGTCYLDRTLGKPIWWNGTVWIDATGATV